MTITSQELQNKLAILASYLENPEPGLSTWHMACADLAEQIFLGLYEVSGPKTRKKLLAKLKGIK